MKTNILKITSSFAALSLMLVGVLSSPSPAKADGRSTLHQALGIYEAEGQGGVTIRKTEPNTYRLWNSNRDYAVLVSYEYIRVNAFTGEEIRSVHDLYLGPNGENEISAPRARIRIIKVLLRGVDY